MTTPFNVLMAGSIAYFKEKVKVSPYFLLIIEI